MPAFNASIFASQLKVRPSALWLARPVNQISEYPQRVCRKHVLAVKLPARPAPQGRRITGAGVFARVVGLPRCLRASVLTLSSAPPVFVLRQSTESAVDTVVKAASRVGTKGGAEAVKVCCPAVPPNPVPCVFGAQRSSLRRTKPRACASVQHNNLTDRTQTFDPTGNEEHPGPPVREQPRTRLRDSLSFSGIVACET
jgi:hypothetical protein